MRTNIDIDDKLLLAAFKKGKYRTKKAAVDGSLRLLAQIQGQKAIRTLRGKIQWEGNLEQSRQSRFPDWDAPPPDNRPCSS